MKTIDHKRHFKVDFLGCPYSGRLMAPLIIEEEDEESDPMQSKLMDATSASASSVSSSSLKIDDSTINHQDHHHDLYTKASKLTIIPDYTASEVERYRRLIITPEEDDLGESDEEFTVDKDGTHYNIINESLKTDLVEEYDNYLTSDSMMISDTEDVNELNDIIDYDGESIIEEENDEDENDDRDTKPIITNSINSINDDITPSNPPISAKQPNKFTEYYFSVYKDEDGSDEYILHYDEDSSFDEYSIVDNQRYEGLNIIDTGLVGFLSLGDDVTNLVTPTINSIANFE